MPAKKHITKEMILSKAFEILRTNGMDSVSVTALAKKLHCSTQPIYLSFKNMDALRAELSEQAVEFFLQFMNESGEEPDLFDMAYIQFAKDEKELFQFLFMRQNAFEELREGLSPIMDQSISRLMDQYHISHDEAHFFHDQLWMHAHGIAAMIATDFCDWDMKKVEHMIEENIYYMGQKYER